jgi:hypothetical protein
MGWETRNGRGSYYTRSRWQGGRVVREYVGSGPVAAIAAQFDGEERSERDALALAHREERARLEAADTLVAAFGRLVDALARRALREAGYYQHHREWRRHGRAADRHPPG